MTVIEYEADIAFLSERAAKAGSCEFSDERDTGMSSNSIVAIAYGGKVQIMPRDQFDLAACERAFAKLPEHRKTDAARDALAQARSVIEKKYQRPA